MPATLYAVRQSAQREANRLKKSMAVLNLNQFSPLYVVRDWNERFAGSRELVERIEPEAVRQDVINEWYHGDIDGDGGLV